MSILDKILHQKRREITRRAADSPLSELQAEAARAPAARGFVKALLACEEPAIIAEIKRASPSKGTIRSDLDPIETAKSYAQNGAACISILTDETFFDGSDRYLRDARALTETASTPLLRKEFIIDSYQVWETRALGADALLLIAAALTPTQLLSLAEEALSANLDILLEVHDEDELLVAAEVIQAISLFEDIEGRFALGINNRNLDTFEMSLETTGRLAKQAEETTGDTFANIPLVSESGIYTAADMRQLRSYGAKAFLIGESLVASGDPGENLAALILEYQRAGETVSK
jgi:indole-3-glycerol phosphate synthase